MGGLDWDHCWRTTLDQQFRDGFRAVGCSISDVIVFLFCSGLYVGKIGTHPSQFSVSEFVVHRNNTFRVLALCFLILLGFLLHIKIIHVVATSFLTRSRFQNSSCHFLRHFCLIISFLTSFTESMCVVVLNLLKLFIRDFKIPYF